MWESIHSLSNVVKGSNQCLFVSILRIFSRISMQWNSKVFFLKNHSWKKFWVFRNKVGSKPLFRLPIWRYDILTSEIEWVCTTQLEISAKKTLNATSEVYLIWVTRGHFLSKHLKEANYISFCLLLHISLWLHKVFGCTIFVQAWLHTIAHLFNLGFNVTGNRDTVYWARRNYQYVGKLLTTYKLPDHCNLIFYNETR